MVEISVVLKRGILGINKPLSLFLETISKTAEASGVSVLIPT